MKINHFRAILVCFIISASFVPSYSRAEENSITWAKKYPGKYLKGTKLNEDGFLYAWGSLNRDNEKLWLMKISQEGETIWEKRYEGQEIYFNSLKNSKRRIVTIFDSINLKMINLSLEDRDIDFANIKLSEEKKSYLCDFRILETPNNDLSILFFFPVYSCYDGNEIKILEISTTGQLRRERVIKDKPEVKIGGAGINQNGTYFLAGVFSDKLRMSEMNLFFARWSEKDETISTQIVSLKETLSEYWSMSPTRDEGYVLIGTVGELPLIHQVIIKINASGTIQWSKKYRPHISLIPILHSISETPDGNYISTGASMLFFTIIPPFFLTNIWVLKVDEMGKTQWNRTFGNLNLEVGNSVINTKDGGSLIAGSELYHIHIDTDLEGWDMNGKLVKLSKNGFKKWSFAFKAKGLSSTEINSVSESSRGGYFVAIDYDSEVQSDSGFAIFKINNKGKCPGWKKQFIHN